jgi:hypothetical protein
MLVDVDFGFWNFGTKNLTLISVVVASMLFLGLSNSDRNSTVVVATPKKMAATIEEIAAELEPETRAALIDKMSLFDVSCSSYYIYHLFCMCMSIVLLILSNISHSKDIATPEDVGLDVADFEIAKGGADLESQVPVLSASDLTPSELSA